MPYRSYIPNRFRDPCLRYRSPVQSVKEAARSPKISRHMHEPIRQTHFLAFGYKKNRFHRITQFRSGKKLGALKTREWKTWHQVARVENAGVDNFRGVFRGPNPLKRWAVLRLPTGVTPLEWLHCRTSISRRTYPNLKSWIRPWTRFQSTQNVHYRMRIYNVFTAQNDHYRGLVLASFHYTMHSLSRKTPTTTTIKHTT